MDDSLPDFTNKVVYVYFDIATPNSRAALADPRFERQGGELFLVGRGLFGKGWGSDIPVGIAWSKVQWYSVFESVEAFQRATRYYNNKNTKFSFWGKEPDREG